VISRKCRARCVDVAEFGLSGRAMLTDLHGSGLLDTSYAL
jgi:hypothetical protein